MTPLSQPEEALVFVHGYLGGGAQWDEQRRFFEDRFNVYTPDLPGFYGKASMPPLKSIQAFAADLLRRLSVKNIKQFHLVGHSMGGMIAQEMAAQAPERILTQTFYGTGPVGVLPGRFETIAQSKERLWQEGGHATARRIAATWFLEREQAQAYEGCAQIAMKASLEAMEAGLTAMEEWHGVDALASMSKRTLILWGDCDRTYPWSQPEALWRSIKNASLAVVPRCAHAVHLERPTLFNALLSDFLIN